MTSTLQARFSDLLQRHVHRLSIRWPRATGLCPFHQERTPSFSVHLEKGVWHCFGCDQSGGVKRFAELVGAPWASTRTESHAARAHRAALAAARDAYNRWQRAQLIVLTDEYRSLVTECEVAGIGYRAVHRCPNLYSDADCSYWTLRLSTLYDRLAVLEHDLDVLTYSKWEPGRFNWWQTE